MTQGAPPGTVKLLQISDTHLHATKDSRMRGVTTYDTLVAVLRHAQRDRRWPVDGVIVSGDIVQDESRAGYELFKSEMAPLGVPVYCIPGNHDDPKLMNELLSRAPFHFCGDARLEGSGDMYSGVPIT